MSFNDNPCSSTLKGKLDFLDVIALRIAFLTTVPSAQWTMGHSQLTMQEVQLKKITIIYLSLTLSFALCIINLMVGKYCF